MCSTTEMKKYPSAPIYQYKPFAEHIDDGFGAIGDAFHEAASRLEALIEKEPFLNATLPIAYLYRHAVELFLKSCIVVLHRALRIPFGGKQPDEPSIKTKDNWVSIRHVHSIGDLYGYLTELLAEQIDNLMKLTTTDWRTIPDELGQWIARIEESDKTSTFFRYPGLGDELKSDFRQSSVQEIWSSLAPDREPMKGFLQFDEDDNTVAAFCLDPSRIEPMMDALRKASETLSTLYFAFRSELGRGS
jgi:hypothetical protein